MKGQQLRRASSFNYILKYRIGCLFEPVPSEKLRLLMIQPPFGGSGLTSLSIVEPLSLECVLAAVEEKAESDILDMRIDSDLERTLAEFRPDVVGITVSTTEVRNAHRVLRQVKEFDSSIVTVVGGFHPTFRPQDFEMDYVDFVVRGEGEHVFRELLDAYINGRRFKDIPGLGYCEHDGRHFIHNVDQALISDLDQLPFPNRGSVEKYRKKYNLIFWQPIASLETARGCLSCCSFCVAWKFHRGSYRAKSPSRVLDELDSIRERQVFVVDDNFLQDTERASILCDKIASRGFDKKLFISTTSVAVARNPGLVKKLVDIGVEFAIVGFESVESNQLKALRKPSTIAHNETAIQLLHDSGIKIWGGFIVDQNFTKEEFNALLEFVNRHEIEVPQFTVLTPLPGSNLFQEREKEITTWNWQQYDTLHTVLPTKMSRSDFHKQVKRLYEQAYLSPRRVIRGVTGGYYPVHKLRGFLEMLDSLKDRAT